MVSDIPAGDGKIVNLFLQCNHTREASNSRGDNNSRDAVEIPVAKRTATTAGMMERVETLATAVLLDT